jgi:hypothetical protein
VGRKTPAKFQEVEPREPGRARIRFAGTFQGDPVIWDATIYTLTRWRRDSDQRGGQPTPGDGRAPRAFIEVGPAAGSLRTITVGLPVDEVDEPVLHKTVIMVRGYKRLTAGRHEFGRTD